MPVAPPFSSPVNIPQTANNSLYPALYLYPLNDTWAPKHITLSNQHTKIGRQTSSKTAPGERNGFFDSKVLSRQHAEVWEENGKVRFQLDVFLGDPSLMVNRFLLKTFEVQTVPS